MRALLATGADPRVETVDGQSVLSGAIGGAWDIDYRWVGCSAHTATVRALLDRAPDLTLPENFWGRSALWFARRKGCRDMIELLRGSGAIS